MLRYYLIPVSFRDTWLTELVEWHGAYLKFEQTNKQKTPAQYVFSLSLRFEPENFE